MKFLLLQTPSSTLTSKIISDHVYPQSPSPPIIVSSIDDGNTSPNAWNLHASTHSHSSSSDREKWNSFPPTEKVIVVMSEPYAPTSFHHLRSLAMSRYYFSYIRNNPHLSLLDSLLSSSLHPLRPAFYNNQIVDKASLLHTKPTPHSKCRLLYHQIVDNTLEWCTSRSNSFNADNSITAG
ncbi:hypothetical protein RHGRI_020377 [Rhododendron griersonianum]|uniref:Maturase K n=1 Tax=Rhododendron griersonianum TaxID=479676 RepID=A0AAV6JK32_9ERIC|nr:hypothetical protein RHGRI_020377 [Rhododendron griersonianum]